MSQERTNEKVLDRAFSNGFRAAMESKAGNDILDDVLTEYINDYTTMRVERESNVSKADSPVYSPVQVFEAVYLAAGNYMHPVEAADLAHDAVISHLESIGIVLPVDPSQSLGMKVAVGNPEEIARAIVKEQSKPKPPAQPSYKTGTGGESLVK